MAINGFEKETDELSETEYKIAEKIAKVFDRLGHNENITMSEIISILDQQSVYTNAGRFRKIIHYLRKTRRVNNLIANSKGYRKCNDPVEIKEYVEGLLQRARSIIEISNTFNIQT